MTNFASAAGRILLPFVLIVPMISGCKNEKPQTGKDGITIYLDADKGDDSADGTSPRKAWKSLERASEANYEAGDRLLLKRGCKFEGILEISGKGTPEARVIIDAYGEGELPSISAPDTALYAVLIKNSDYLTLQNLDITNHGPERLPQRTGVKVLSEDYGISHNIELRALHIHDVNGTLAKGSGEGSGILIENRWDEIPSAFDSLIIEDCIIRRCERNAMIWSGAWNRQRWFPSTNVIVRKNLIEEVPGDGIVPIGCDGALVEYNLMRNGTALLPEGDAAAGMWPWSSDNTILQYNEVSGHKAPWDGQGFDCDYGCYNTTIRYNYSHDNYGGLVLICCPGTAERDPELISGNEGSLVQYNVSIGDGLRPYPTRAGMFAPIIHVAGTTKDTRVLNNILHTVPKPAPDTDRSMITSDSWSGYSDSTLFAGNVFYAAENYAFRFSKSTNDLFKGNWYLGDFTALPKDASAKTDSEYYERLISEGDAFEALDFLFDKVEIAGGAAEVKAVNKERIEAFFGKMSE